MKPNMYKQALDVQDACNLSGVVNTLLHDILPEIRAEFLAATNPPLTYSTNNMNTHPVVKLFVDKLAHLAQVQGVNDTLFDAYAVCRDRSNGK